MMKQMLAKEFRLAIHPTNLLFLGLSAMMLIPNYPYYVTFFYTSLSMFFTCLNGRENNDIFYSATLPAKKREIVKARYLYVMVFQMLQFLVAVPFALLRQSMDMPGNAVGMDANIALFAFSFGLYAVFNAVFFGIYYKNVNKVGKAFVVASILEFVYIGIAEAVAHVVPVVRDQLDTPDPQFLGAKLIALAIGAAVYIAVTVLSYRSSVKHFEAWDL
ncbi:MAG: ABC-2 transporter permease [Eubacteriales bacterium]|nr:ABC-2 transporter permease [Eubacteriales bacterium]